MNTIRKVSPIAIAIAALVAAPLAFAGAAVNNDQSSVMNLQGANWNSTNSAVLTDSAGQGAQGNIGFNIASGSQNQQSNAGALASNTNIDVGDGFASSATTIAKQVAVMDWAFQVATGGNLVSFTGNALQGAVGNIGVNMASGYFNQQGNNLSASSAQNSDYARAKSNTTQASGYLLNLSTGNYNSAISASNNTGLYGNVLSGASGNIGVNEAAGISNQQSNSLSVATASNNDHEGYPIGATATTNTDQVAGMRGALQGTPMFWQNGATNVAGVAANALQNASGNISVNLASGVDNQQSNSTALSATSNTYNKQRSVDYAAAKAATNQTSVLNGSVDTNVIDSTTVGGNAGQGASGNIGINVASGAQNQQQNGLAMAAIASSKALGTASAPVLQNAAFNGSMSMCSDYSATVSGNALQNATGNIGLNIASGNNNQQSNTLAIASVTK
ncbi:hypothetical protein HFU84_02195 [Acidithiobacillus sp. CV18-2]|uniref:Adhesin n=1 Tax=Igneacidithiobacillus copahuensis TaxID=2724909 RepID=A0AAE2YPV5_9PROT|nr:hypothetical protein [Igneacidithiobacillus copahuensis]MBU2753624.1 hypothetical protein [Acidithiobacillus sp. CV18-3]MBU2758524.1 hypothetical protein [Acidithiobacillus sp. BN09-2]MBU2776342.1 hypothetical protein [Acidithiobacillus sp. CV18-2]MBU2795258.1 hypothetical protein [Acidithiobacillus sp. VAN18-2]MBU2799516.1 hypothetical protein [Acidithiobacillus sp. VAN18-4]UTV81315.1 hypothetical protein MQE22_01495 [Acidithiobacillus sp. YTS05]